MQRVEADPVSFAEALATGEAASDLRTGTLRSHSVGQGYYRVPAPPAPVIRLEALGFSSASLYDTITFQGSGLVELRMTVEGAMVGDAGAENVAQGFLNTCTSDCDNGAGYGEAYVRVEGGSPTGTIGAVVQMLRATGSGAATTNANSSGVFDPSDIRFTLSAFADVSPANPTLTFIAGLFTSANVRPAIDIDEVFEADTGFGNTAQLELIVPQGVSWTSASGAFLVPEPSTFALLTTGLGALCASARLRRASGYARVANRNTRRGCGVSGRVKAVNAPPV